MEAKTLHGYALMLNIFCLLLQPLQSKTYKLGYLFQFWVWQLSINNKIEDINDYISG